MISVQRVDIQNVSIAWPLVAKYLQSAFDLGDDVPDSRKLYSLDNVRQYISSGEWLLIVAVDTDNKVCGAATVSFANFPFHRVAFVTAIGGRLIVSKDTFKQFDDILKQHGATMIQAYGRESIVRLWRRFGFKPRNTLVERLL